MKNKIILVTGASSGIGKETALKLAQMGNTVIIHGRNPQKTRQVFDEIQQLTGNQNLDMITADLSLMADVVWFANEIKNKYDHLDVLINNAGGQFGTQREETSEGHEKTIAINTYAPFLLTYLLLGLLSQSLSGRVVTVSSASYSQGGQWDLSDFELHDRYSLARSYGTSKLYIYWLMNQFAARAPQWGITNVTFNTVEPGSADTSLGRVSAQKGLTKLIYWLWKPMMWSVERAAATSIYMATSSKVEGVTGKFYGNLKEKRIRTKFRVERDERITWEHCVQELQQYLE